jgi:hypothetical protein
MCFQQCRSVFDHECITSSTKDQCNGWLKDKLFVSFEESESDNYTFKTVNYYIKHCTNKDTSIQSMHKITRAGI